MEWKSGSAEGGVTMNFIVCWKGKNVVGKASLALPDRSLPEKEYVRKLEEFILVVDKLNTNLKKNRMQVTWRLEQ